MLTEIGEDEEAGESKAKLRVERKLDHRNGVFVRHERIAEDENDDETESLPGWERPGVLVLCVVWR